MLPTNRLRRNGTVAMTAMALGVSALVVAPSVNSASAVSDECASFGAVGTAQTGVCEISFFASGGDVSWTPPAGITKLEALLVGAGATGTGTGSIYGTSYAGGGGEVKLVELSTTGVVAIVIGQGGPRDHAASMDSSVTQASVTTTANGADGSTSGSGYDLFLDNNEQGGNGAGGDIVLSYSLNGGPGLVVSSLANLGSLFANVDDCYGGGGAAKQGSATCGGSYLVGSTAQIFENTGGGGFADSGGVGAGTGQSGVVKIRFALGSTTPAETLAATGSNAAGIFGGAALALVAGAAALLATGRRKLTSR